MHHHLSLIVRVAYNTCGGGRRRRRQLNVTGSSSWWGAIPREYIIFPQPEMGSPFKGFNSVCGVSAAAVSMIMGDGWWYLHRLCSQNIHFGSTSTTNTATDSSLWRSSAPPKLNNNSRSSWYSDDDEEDGEEHEEDMRNNWENVIIYLKLMSN